MKKYLIGLLFIHYYLFISPAGAQNYGYTDDRPLVIAADWDFQPFEFLTADGRPSGYNIEVLDLILNQLGIPHRFVMQEWHAASEMFAHRQADLIHALAYNFKGRPYVTTKKYINYYNLCVARHAANAPLASLRHLGPGDTLMLKQDDYAALTLRAMGPQPFVQEYASPKSALTAVSSNSHRYFVWGKLPMKRKIQELHLDSIAVDEIDIPAGELRIIGYDPTIVSLIDEEFTRLEQAGDIQPIIDRWFYPERQHDNASPIALFVIAGIAVVILVAFLLSRLITRRVKSAVRQSADLNSMMLQALSMGEYSVLIYDLHTHMVKNHHAHLLPPAGITIDELISRIDPDQRSEFREKIEATMRGDIDQWTMERRWNAGTPEAPQWHTFYGNAILERDGSGRPRYIIHTVKDITREVADEAHNQELSARYQLLFDTNILAMSIYDSTGRLIDCNQKMRQLCVADEQSRRYYSDTNLFDIPSISGDFDPHSRQPLYICQHTQLPTGADIYVENKILPLCDDADQLVFYIVTSRDITAERDMYMQERRHERQLVEANEAVRRYDSQLSYLLEESKIFVWHYDPATDMVHFSRKPHVAEYSETLNDFMQGVPESSRAAALIGMRDAIRRQEPFSVVHQYNYTPLQDEPCWFSVSGMPTFADDGRLLEFFGIARDITRLMSAQEQLRQETARAEDSGRLKSAFLANMTHEIRTPLNAIVGFSDLLQMVEEPQERLEFIRIIRSNCDMLLRLINDILEASTMSQSLTIEPQPLDLAATFRDICLSLRQRVDSPDVQFLTDSPYDSFSATLDAGRLQQLLTNFVTNAVKYTSQGHIRVGYHEQGGGIYFYCEDTGAGIPKEQQASVFERFVKLNDFVQGTGLGLSICRAIVERCGGHIGVDSEGPGHGSTFWFWLPRHIEV